MKKNLLNTSAVLSPKVLLPRSQQSRPLNSLHLRMAPSLDLVLGEWEDANGNHYDVTLDDAWVEL